MYETIIGLEIHLELNTRSKLFCSCPAGGEISRPNQHICPVCLGHPGVLPVLNKEAIKKALIVGLAANGELVGETSFDRKNYFYPDLPKGYQISQYNLPLVKGGYLEIDIKKGDGPRSGTVPEVKKVCLERIHLEEDAAKLLYSEDKKWSLLDFNRAGVPLLEIVTKPEICSPEEAKIFLEELQLIARYLEVSEAEMEKGQMRCDANISLRPQGAKKYFPKTEIKNLNSFKAVEGALSYEKARQTELWKKGSPPKSQSTRGWDEEEKVTFAQRGKEETYDYRYFPEPDLPPLNLKELRGQGINPVLLKKDLPELPRARRIRFSKMYGFSPAEARILTDDKNLANFTEKAISELKGWLISLETVEGSEKEVWQKYKKRLVKLVGNWLINRLLHLIGQAKIGTAELKITPENFAEFIILVYENKVSSTLAQKVLEKMFTSGRDLDRIMREGKMSQIEDEGKLTDIIEEVIQANPEVVESIQKGKINAIQFLVGQVMKKSRGRAEPKIVRELLERKIL